MNGVPTVVVIADPALGCIPDDIHASLSESAVYSVLMTAEEFKRFPAAVVNAQVVVAGANVRFDGECMDRMTKLRAIVFAIVGVDAVDLKQAALRSIAVANSPAIEASESLAEASILLILACLYGLPFNQKLLQNSEKPPSRPTARMLKGRTVGLVGFGRTAQEVAIRLNMWGVKILAYARRPTSFQGVEFTTLENLMQLSDVVSVHAALNNETRNLLDAQLLASMKVGSVLVNTARGAIVDESALADLVGKGHISAVGLDVFSREPLPNDSPLRALEHAILTPHRLGHTAESFGALCKTASENVRNFLDGQPLRNAVQVHQ